MTDDDVLRGELRDELVGAMQRVPELAGRELDLTALSGGITNRNFLVAIPGERRPLRHPARRQRHAPARHQPRGRARGDGRRGRRRRRAGGHRVHPARGLPRHAVHRGLAGQRSRRSASATRWHGSPIRSGASTTGRPIPGLFVPLRIVEAYRGAGARPAACRIPPEYELAASIGRRIELACLADPVELRPCHNDLLNANFIDDGARIRIVDWEYAGMGDPVLRPRQLQHQPRADAATRTRACWRRTRAPRRAGPPGAADAHARRVGLPRGDVGRAPAGHQHARRRLRRVRRRALRPTARERLDAGVRASRCRERRPATDARASSAAASVAEGRAACR